MLGKYFGLKKNVIWVVDGCWKSVFVSQMTSSEVEILPKPFWFTNWRNVSLRGYGKPRLFHKS